MRVLLRAPRLLPPVNFQACANEVVPVRTTLLSGCYVLLLATAAGQGRADASPGCADHLAPISVGESACEGRQFSEAAGCTLQQCTVQVPECAVPRRCLHAASRPRGGVLRSWSLPQFWLQGAAISTQMQQPHRAALFCMAGTYAAPFGRVIERVLTWLGVYSARPTAGAAPTSPLHKLRWEDQRGVAVEERPSKQLTALLPVHVFMLL